ncbi:hypothetical protein N6H18_01200 [Reichenbachiella agarivorans]|uniref:Lipocalin-like domain-containing protein n=1 Tax=Reichenbachiella agarivorans TaxID=2979464 RepID=A0ABY6CPZ2_9BACT|nr:hypothetical protein [Reichenbachiella agarivorans]UXP32587.1 hypothetical protein N6H18_01200 [Reichenbachiella agarivorans]
MKKFINYLTAALFLSMVVLSGCGGSDDDGGDGGDTDYETIGTLMNGTYTATSVSNPDASDADWTGFTLTITGGSADGGNYSTAGVPDGFSAVWPASGTWTFDKSSSTVVIERNDGVEMDAEITNDLLAQLSFAVESGAAARTSEVDGTWIFKLAKQ